MTPNDPYLEALGSAHTIAVLGESDRPERAGYYVPEYLHGQGYRVVGVNPGHLSLPWVDCWVLPFEFGLRVVSLPPSQARLPSLGRQTPGRFGFDSGLV